jgi:putative flavoprotein involved in K+ transport
MLDKAPNGKVSELLTALDQALSAPDVERAVALFQSDCYWRDLVTFTWNIKTMEGKDQVRDMLEARLAITAPSNWKIADGEDASEADGITESWIQFETAVARGFGHIRLKDGQIWTLLTTMSELKGHEEPLGFDRPMGAKHGAERGRKTWKEEREAEAAELGISRQPYCVIVGGGQGGIALAARLRQLDVPTIIIEKNERPGDSWRNRYKSLCLHDPVWYDHLPYLPFPRNWPVFSPKDKIGDWLEMYTKVMELNYWSSTECKRAS